MVDAKETSSFVVHFCMFMGVCLCVTVYSCMCMCVRVRVSMYVSVYSCVCVSVHVLDFVSVTWPGSIYIVPNICFASMVSCTGLYHHM
jgi:hypothetical protein